MNKLALSKRKAIIAALMEGVGVNAISRLTGVCKETILKLQGDLGLACAKFHDDNVRGLKPARIQCDEVWSFVHCKAKNIQNAKSRDFGIGDCWNWTAIDPDSKLLITYHIGLRTPTDARIFMLDLAGRVNSAPQLTTDGLGFYIDAVRNAFGDDVDFAQLIKVFKTPSPDHSRYSPGECIGCEKKRIQGNPDFKDVSTSIVERSNLTIRMSMKRYARLSNGHSKKIENHCDAFAVFTMHYNYCRKHLTLKGKTPAMAAGLADHVWTMDELIGLIERDEHASRKTAI